MVHPKITQANFKDKQQIKYLDSKNLTKLQIDIVEAVEHSYNKIKFEIQNLAKNVMGNKHTTVNHKITRKASTKFFTLVAIMIKHGKGTTPIMNLTRIW